jgi:hypothetical protein
MMLPSQKTHTFYHTGDSYFHLYCHILSATVAISIHTLLPLGEKITSVAGMALGIHWPFLDSKSQQCYTKLRGCEKNAMTNVYKTF